MGGSCDLLGDGRLLKRVELEGAGPSPQKGDRVQVRYETRHQGKCVESMAEDAFEFVLGEDQVLEAWDLGVATMKPGERSVFTVHPSLAFGEEGAGEEIPASATLEFTIHLFPEKAEAQAPKEQSGSERSGPGSTKKLLGEEQRLRRAQEAKVRGNGLFKAGEYSAASKAYKESLMLLQSSTLPAMQGQESLDLLRESSQLRVAVLLNLSQCCLKLEDYSAAAQHATDALDLEPSCKALFRRALAQLARGSLTEARDDLQAALQLEPQNREVREKLELCRTRMQQAQAWQKQAFGGLFGKAPEQSSRQRTSEALSSLPKVWMEIQIGSKPAGRVEIILYKDTVPRTAENFLKLCTGELSTEKRRLHYRHSIIHKVVPGCLIEAGDIEKSNGMGGQSIYGPTFADEAFADAHQRRGLLSMSNRGPDTNGSRFFFTLRSLPEFDGKHVVFGEVSSGHAVLDAMEAVETEYPDWPVTPIRILRCGQVADLTS